MNAVIYARYSSDNQREESIDAQIRAIKEFASTKNYQIVKIYVDEAKSATTDNRPEFLNMIRDSSSGLFDIAIVHKLDRFSRDRYDSAFYKRALKKNGVKLLSVLENLDDSPESIILESVLEGMAEYYSKNLSREVMKGMNETALQCKHTGGSAPLGYDVAPNKTYVINESEAIIVRLIFEMYASENGYGTIINKLNELGYKTKKGNEFGKNSLYDILRNEKYIGTYTFNKSSAKKDGKRNNHSSKDNYVRIKNGMPRIISDEIFNIVGGKAVENKHRGGANNAKEVYLLSGLVECGKCGGKMSGNRKYAGRNKDLYITYECCNRKYKKNCDAKSISSEFVETEVMKELKKKIFSEETAGLLATQIYDYAISNNKQLNDDVKHFQKELIIVQSDIDNIVEAITKGMFHISMKEKMDILEEKKLNLKLYIQDAQEKLNLFTPSKEIIKNYLIENGNIIDKPKEKQKAIINDFVEKVIIIDNDVKVIVRLSGGGEGSRTPVRKPIHMRFSECS